MSIIKVGNKSFKLGTWSKIEIPPNEDIISLTCEGIIKVDKDELLYSGIIEGKRSVMKKLMED